MFWSLVVGAKLFRENISLNKSYSIFCLNLLFYDFYDISELLTEDPMIYS